MEQQGKPPFHYLTRAVILKEGKVLMALAAGCSMGFLPGGHIEYGESAKEALQRELGEEMGIQAEVGRFLGVIEHQWEQEGVTHYECNQLFLVDSPDLSVAVDPPAAETHLTFRWCTAGELGGIQPYPLERLLPELLAGTAQLPWWESTLPEQRL